MCIIYLSQELQVLEFYLNEIPWFKNRGMDYGDELHEGTNVDVLTNIINLKNLTTISCCPKVVPLHSLGCPDEKYTHWLTCCWIEVENVCIHFTYSWIAATLTVQVRRLVEVVVRSIRARKFKAPQVLICITRNVSIEVFIHYHHNRKFWVWQILVRLWIFK